VFFTLGSANINVRSMEVDSELNIASPSPELTRQWREHLWRIHTGEAPMVDMKEEFNRWGKLMRLNSEAMSNGEPLSASLMDFYDDGKSPIFSFD